MSTMRRQERTRLCEWADLVGADLPDEIACEPETGSRPSDERFDHEQ